MRTTSYNHLALFTSIEGLDAGSEPALREITILRSDRAVPGFVENVTDRASNPFGMSPPCEVQCSTDVPAVFGYGDANADFHVIGDHPGVHGGRTTGVPFTESIAGERLQDVFYETGFLAEPYADAPRTSNLFLDYVHMCCSPAGATPPPESYAELERFFDAELRAINAHILLPVGARATERVVAEYTTQSRKVTWDMDLLHATEVRGRGFLVVPIEDPAEWEEGDRERIVARLSAILASDYRQTKGVATTIG